MKALVGAFNQEKALVGAFSVIVQPVVEPMDHFTALIVTLASSELRMSGSWKQGLCNCCGDCGVCMCGLCCEPCLVYR